MPTATNLTINNGSAVAKTFTLYAPAAGYGSEALWKLKEGAHDLVFPMLTLSARPTNNQSRQTRVKFRMPQSYIDSTTGMTLAGSAFEFNGVASVPNDFPESMKTDAIAFVANAIANALVNECMRDGTPAT